MANYTYHNLYTAAKQAIRQVDGEMQAEFTARELVAAATDRTVGQLVADFTLSVFKRDIDRVQEMVERYLKGEPLAYILGQWDFYGLKLYVTSEVLIPRDDTEAVTTLAIEKLRGLHKTPRVLDLCTGSGCIGLAIAAKVRDARVTLGELSPGAIRVAKKNIQVNHLGARVQCIEMDARKTPPTFLGKYDMLVSNPPYVTAQQMEELDSSVRDYEPGMALFGGTDGLDFYRDIVKYYGPLIRPGGYICFEFGMGQEADVCKILMENGFILTKLARDTGERARAVLAQKPEEENN